MKTATLVLQNAVRLLGVVLIILGFLFWTHNAYNLVPLHSWLAIILIVLLWILAGIGATAKVTPTLVAVSFLWGALVLYFGMTMGRILPGRAHEIVRVLHFLLGLGAIGLAESLGARIKRRTSSGVR